MKAFALISLALLLTACSGQALPSALPAPSPDLFMSSQYTQATAEAVQAESRYLQAQLTATAEAPIVHITETAAAFQIQSRQTADSGAATAASGQQTATQAAAIAEATATAAQTATAASWTATAVQNAAIVEAASQAAQQTAIANQTERDNLQLQRAKWQNQFNALLPALLILFFLLALLMAGFMAVRHFSFRRVPRDARGDAVPLLDLVDGVIVDSDRSLYPQTGTKRRNLKQLPPLTREDQQRVTERDQAIDLATRGALDRPMRSKTLSEIPVTPQLPPPVVQIVPPEQIADALRPILPEVAQDAMDAEVIEEPHEHQP